MPDIPVNPYPNEHDTTDYQISARHAWWIALLFFPVVTLLPFMYHLSMTVSGKWPQTPAATLLSWRPSQGELLTRLHETEKLTDNAGYATWIRETTQGFLTRQVREGNQKVFIGNFDWLYYQPELSALRGWGPIKREPFSPMKDPSVAQLRMAKDIVLEFAADLKARGIPLLLVPLPVKPMIYPEFIVPGRYDAPLYHPDQLALYAEFRNAGIEVLDLAPEFFSLKKRFPLFLKQDTHWTPEAMQNAARQLYDYIHKQHPDLIASESPLLQPQPLDLRSYGDLVHLLDLRNPGSIFQEEEATLVSLGGVEPDRDSPIVLIGDSFVNVFDDPALGFANPEAPTDRLKAGFARYVSMRLHQPLDVYAVNGGGATQARREFARRTDDDVRSKKLVIWAIACRDLLLSPNAARSANVEWAATPFNPNRSTKDTATPSLTSTAEAPVVVEATLVEKSRNQPLNGTPYIDALHTAVYKVDRVVSGKFDPSSEWQAIQWTFKMKAMQPSASVTVGKRYRLTLEPWDEQTELKDLNIQNDNTTLDEFTADRWFVANLRELP